MSHPLPSTSSRPPRGFTLVEILVVVAIIVILMAILIPVAMRAVSQARNAAIGVELSQLKTALDEYKREHGDYPPSLDWDPGNASMGTIPATPVAQQQKWWDSSNSRPSAYAYSSICERHFLRCYPKMNATEKNKFYGLIAPILEQDEVLVFWLSMIANDPREPFKNFAVNNNNKLYYAGGVDQSKLNFTDFPGSYPRFVHYDFDTRRLQDVDDDDGDGIPGDGIPGYKALYSKDTTYMYFDSRTYSFTQDANYAARANLMGSYGVAQPMTDAVSIANNQPKFVNPNTFQILCAGQDGNYGNPVYAYNFNTYSVIPLNTRMFPTMINTNEEDSDNMADFTEGRRLIDHRP